MDWKQEAINQAAAAGELRLQIGQQLEEVRTQEVSIQRMLLLEDNTLDQVILSWKLGKIKEWRTWLEGVLYGNQGKESNDTGTDKGKVIPG